MDSSCYRYRDVMCCDGVAGAAKEKSTAMDDDDDEEVPSILVVPFRGLFSIFSFSASSSSSRSSSSSSSSSFLFCSLAFKLLAHWWGR